jgi:Ca-activated chloride channel family protein
MPKPMAQALGWPDAAIGYRDLLALAQDPQGWASKGHPEWGPFRLGKTNLNFSTSALAATTAQYYAATGKVRDLTLEDLDRPDVQAFSKAVESSVVHYGDTTLTFLNNWYRNDLRGTALTYVSAVAVEEKSVIDYNRGNPDGITQAGEVPKRPRVPLVAVYPKEGTFFSDNPFFVLDAPWVTPDAKAAAQRFADFVRQPENQRQVLRTGFRPGNPAVAMAAPITRDNGVDPAQPQTTLGIPSAPVLVKVIDQWAQLRKGARVLLVLDVSGSMGDDAGNGDTKLDLAKQAAIDALTQFKDDDLVGLRVFTTGASPKDPTDYLDLVPIGPIGGQREVMRTKIDGLIPREGTPLYTTAKAAYQGLKDSFDPARINAVVLLTDGQNDDPRNNDLDGLISSLRAGSEGLSTSPVRLFTIAYGKSAALGVLKRMAEATNAAAYDASDPQTIANVFTAVISNF